MSYSHPDADSQRSSDTPPKGPFGRPYPLVYVDGEYVDQDTARLSINAHVISYGTGTFEGMRATYNEAHGELYLMEPLSHYARLEESAKILGMPPPPDPNELTQVTVELLRRNKVRGNAYIRPLYVISHEALAVHMHDYETRLSIAITPIIGDYVSLDGLSCKVSSWRRPPDTVIPARAKVIGSYITNAMAKTEAVGAGYDETLMLTVGGLVSEGSTSNVFMRRGQVWVTPPVTDDILEGITRSQVMTLLAEQGSDVIERSIHRSELYICDELFLCGTAALIAPVVAVDDRTIAGGKPGQTTLSLLQTLRSIAVREISEHAEWTLPVYKEENAA